MEWEVIMAVTYFGNNVTGTLNGGMEAGTIFGSLFTANLTGNMSELGMLFHTAYTGNVRLGVYAYAASTSQPGARLLDAGELVNPGSGWQSKLTLTLAIVNATQYWLVAICSADTPAYINYEQTGGVGLMYYWPRSGGYGALPTPCPTTSGGEGNTLCIRAGVEAVATTIGPSGAIVTGQVTNTVAMMRGTIQSEV